MRPFGKTIRIQVDPVDASEPDFVTVQAVVEQVIGGTHNGSLLIVRPAAPIAISPDFTVTRMLLVGIDMDLVKELFGTPQRPRGLPVVAGVWRLKDATSIERVVSKKHPPSSKEYLGRAQVSTV